MRVLLTGAAGFIGTAVGTALERAGHEVLHIDAFLPQAHPPGAGLPGAGLPGAGLPGAGLPGAGLPGAGLPGAGLRSVERLDVRDSLTWHERLRGVDVVCHQAALVGTGADVADLPAYASLNDLGTAALLAAMHAAGVRDLVLASSMVVYGEGSYTCVSHGPQTAPPRRREDLEAGRFDPPCPVCAGPLDWELVDEDARLDPRSGYAASKVAQEHYAAAWARETGGSVTALRYHNVYGPGMPRDTPYSGVAAIFRSALERGEPPQVFEDGEQERDFVHLDDVARANLLALEAIGDPGFTAYNVSSGIPVPIGAVADLVAGGSGTAARPVVTGRYRLGDVRHVVASPERARTGLGFTAQVHPRDGLTAFATAPLRAPVTSP